MSKERKIENLKNKKLLILIIVVILIGIIVGIISGLFASGGGLLLVPIYTYILKLDEKEARATSLFCILPMVILTAIVYNKNNYIDWSLGIKCAIGGIIGRNNRRKIVK